MSQPPPADDKTDQSTDKRTEDSAPSDIDRLRQALARTPDDKQVRLALGQLLAQRGEAGAARTVLEPLAHEGPEHIGPDDTITRNAVLTLARLHTDAGQREDAVQAWERLLADDIDHAEARAQLARLQTDRSQSQLPAAPRNDATLVSPSGVTTAHYDLLHEIGRGATSTVYLAKDRNLEIEVALKVLHPSMGAASRASARERFFWEARAAARLRHPGVAAIYDLDERARSLAMEYLPAGTLRTRLTEAKQGGSGVLDADEILQTATGLLDTLQYVHGSGLVHGDLKPRNILLRKPGVPVLGDFGVARLVQDDPRNAEGPAGTPLFLAPEQLRGAPASPGTDLFAVGAILWEMAVGRPMRTRADLTSGRYGPQALPDAARTHLSGDATAPLVPLIGLLLAETPENRPQSAENALALIR